MAVMTTQEQTSTAPRRRLVRGLGQALVAVYGILALAATARSAYQIAAKFDEAPVAYLFSAFSGVVYILATLALALHARRAWRLVAWVTISVELAGVLVVGLLSVFDSGLFPHDSVWSGFGAGYAYIPLVLPVLGLIWLGLGDRDRGTVHGADVP